MTVRRAFIIYWLPLLLYGLLIFIQSSGPAPPGLPEVIGVDKLLHLAAYALMGALCYRAFSSLAIERKSAVVFSLLAGVLYGVSDEVHQYFVPARDAELLDAVADAIGTACGVFLLYRYRKNKIGATAALTSNPRSSKRKSPTC